MNNEESANYDVDIEKARKEIELIEQKGGEDNEDKEHKSLGCVLSVNF